MAIALILPAGCGGGPQSAAQIESSPVVQHAPSFQPVLHRTPPGSQQAAARIKDNPIALAAQARVQALPPPRQVMPRRPLQCVPYARARSRIQIHGDAWTWWRTAAGRYQRGNLPAVGSVLVLQRRGRSRGHVAYVQQIVSDREIIVDHANWLNRGLIHENARVRDISGKNDWSRVNVWHTPGRQYGKSVYRPYGFIYPLELPSAARSTRGTISRRGQLSDGAGPS